ncbi:hypothetical protein BH09SUM1_BH09SUM1_28610 [soil metagenome]
MHHIIKAVAVLGPAMCSLASFVASVNPGAFGLHEIKSAAFPANDHLSPFMEISTQRDATAIVTDGPQFDAGCVLCGDFAASDFREENAEFLKQMISVSPNEEHRGLVVGSSGFAMSTQDILTRHR